MIALLDIVVTDTGELGAPVYRVLGHDGTGAEWIHETEWRGPRALAAAEYFVSRVRAVNLKIDPARWEGRAPYGTDAWSNCCEYAELEREYFDR